MPDTCTVLTPTDRHAPLPPEDGGPEGPKRGQKDGFLMTGSHLTRKKVPETLKFPGLSGCGGKI